MKIVGDLSQETENAVYRALVSQLLILGHSEVWNHRNINNLIGVCWDVRPGENTQSYGHTRLERDILPRNSLTADQEDLSDK